MATTTPNFGWSVPTSTDLVKDGATAIETLGDSIDASLVDLKGGTTGQVLAKASNADMDFVWSADAAGMTNPMTSVGDLIRGGTSGAPTRLGIGSTGQVLTVSGGVPTWATSSSGGMTLLSTTSLSGSSVTLSSIPSGYVNLFVIIQGYRPSAINIMRCRFNGDSTSNRYYQWSFAAGDQYNTVFNSTNFYLSDEQNTSTSNSLVSFQITDYSNTTTWKTIQGMGINNGATTSTQLNARNYSGIYNQTSAITSLEIYVPSGTFSAGTVLLYGVK